MKSKSSGITKGIKYIALNAALGKCESIFSLIEIKTGLLALSESDLILNIFLDDNGLGAAILPYPACPLIQAFDLPRAGITSFINSSTGNDFFDGFQYETAQALHS